MTGAGRVISSCGVLIPGSNLRGALRLSRNRLSTLVIIGVHSVASLRGSSVKLLPLLVVVVVVVIVNGVSPHYLPRLSHGLGRGEKERLAFLSTGRRRHRCRRGVGRGGRRRVSGLRRGICGLDCCPGLCLYNYILS